MDNVRCFECNCERPFRQIQIDDDEYLCMRCYSLFYVPCDICGEVKRGERYITIHDKTICEGCVEDYYYKCDECGLCVREDEIIADHRMILCPACYDNSYFTCSDCGRIDYTEEAVFSITRDCLFCEYCVPSEELRTWRARNLPSLPTDYEILLGAEVECYPDIDDHFGLESMQGLEADTEPTLQVGGIEYRTPPLPPAQQIEFCRDLCERSRNGHVAKDCGLHIHISVRDWTWRDVRTVLTYCIAHQRAILEHVNANNAFDRQKDCAYSNEIPNGVSFGGCKNEAEFLRRIEALPRYTWINCQPYSYQGTIEFRGFCGTLNEDIIETHLKTVCDIVTTALGIVNPLETYAAVA